MDFEELELEFDPDTHTYVWNGAKRPSCTEVLTLARKPLDRIPKDVLDRATERGKSVHHAVHLHTIKDLYKPSMTQAIRLRIKWWEWFLKEYNVKPIPSKQLKGGFISEVPLVHPIFGFGVTPDLGAAMVLDVPSVVEVKAVSVLNDSTALQTAAQLKTVQHIFPELEVQDRYVVQLFPDKRPNVECYRDSTDWATYLSFMNVFNWRRSHKVD